MKYQYTWKRDFEDTSWTAITTEKPFVVGVAYNHLADGNKYLVDAIYEAKPNDKGVAHMPNTVVHMRKIGQLSIKELTELWEKLLPRQR